MESNDRLKNIYLLLDSGNNPLARGVLESPPGMKNLQIRVLDDKAGIVAEHEIIELISTAGSELPLQCRLLRQRDERIVLERLATLDPEIRRNLRVPIKFDTFIYPLTGGWKGRQTVRSIDLSCGGIAFYGSQGLEVGEQMEVVIPLTDEPLILRCQILKRQELRNERMMYAAKFVDMCEDEEFMVRRTVFSIQLQNEPRHAKTEEEPVETAT